MKVDLCNYLINKSGKNARMVTMTVEMKQSTINIIKDELTAVFGVEVSEYYYPKLRKLFKKLSAGKCDDGTP